MKRRHRVALAVPMAAMAACSSPAPQAALTKGPRTTTSTTTTAEPTTTAATEIVEPGPATPPVPDATRDTPGGPGPATPIPANSVANGPLPVDVGGTLACIRSYEGDYGTDTGNGHYGAYQFDLGTWESVGGEGNPAEATPKEQDARAAQLLAERGLQPWPTPARRC